VKLEIPVEVGVPVIWPVVALKFSPSGNVPLVINHMYGGVPPLAANGGAE
jgi:hypothetical protein